MRFTGERLVPTSKKCHKDSNIYKEHINRYLFASKFVKKKSVLDTACGAGYGSALLLKKGAKEVYGIDISQEAIQYAKKHYSDRHSHFSKMDMTDLKFKNNFFDVIVSFEAIEHIRNQKKYLSEVKKAIKPDGTFIISSPNKPVYDETLKLGPNPFHPCELDEKEFLDLLKKYFKKVELYGQRRKLGANSYSKDYYPRILKKGVSPIYFVAVCRNKK